MTHSHHLDLDATCYETIGVTAKCSSDKTKWKTVDKTDFDPNAAEIATVNDSEHLLHIH